MRVPVSRTAVLLLLAMAGIIGATRRDFTRRNPDLLPDMASSPAYGSQSDRPLARALVPALEGTVPRGYTPYPYANTPEGRGRAARELVNPLPRSAAVMARGRELYGSFCQHCHGSGGTGTGGVARRVPAFSMSIVGRATADLPDGELFHILTWGQNNMPAHGSQIRQEDRWRILHYLRDLQGEEEARLARMGIRYQEDTRPNGLVSAEYGAELFAGNCASCHGPEGMEPRRGVPTLNLARVLAVAGEDFYLDIISHGRKGSEMVAWDRILTPTQIRSLVAYIRTWNRGPADRTGIAAAAGDPVVGRALFNGNCAGCHGRDGQGGIGNSLRSPSFQAMASDDFLRDTIALGRGHTAMPSGSQYTPQDIADLLSFLRSWSGPRSTLEEVRALLPAASDRIGRKIFAAKCASCHGRDGEGAIGPRLASDSFLAMADDAYLWKAIVRGRPGTAMPSWSFLEPEDVADLIAWIRRWRTSPPADLHARRRRGRPDFGELLYARGCLPCHGPEGRGGLGNQIGNRVFLESASDEFLFRTIARGKDGTAMRGFLRGSASGALMPMDEGDIEHVIAYLRELQVRPRADAPKRPTLSSDVAVGRGVYEGKGACAQCHGSAGEGASGPSIGNPQFLAAASDGFIMGTIVLGREGTEMKSFYRGGNVDLTPADVEAVTAYVRSLGGEPTGARRMVERTGATVALGAELFASHCASCHGSEGRGPRGNAMNGYAPSLNNPQFLAAADDGFLQATIALGRPGTPMRAFARGMGGISELSAADIRRIVAYIRSWQAGVQPAATPAGEEGK